MALAHINFTGSCSDSFTGEEVLHSRSLSREEGSGLLLSGNGVKGNPRRQGAGEVLPCVGGVTQQRCRQSLSVRELRGQQRLGVFMALLEQRRWNKHDLHH